MTTAIKHTIRPQASLLTFGVLAIVMISFGLFAQHQVDRKGSAQLNAQVAQTTSIDQ